MTAKEAREFRESGETKKTEPTPVTVSDGVEKWLEVCEKEGRDGRDFVNSYGWEKSLQELTATRYRRVPFVAVGKLSPLNGALRAIELSFHDFGDGILIQPR